MKTKKDIESIFHLSPLQEGLLFHAIADKAADPYFTQTGFLLEGKLDPEAFAQAWQVVVDRHAILRTCFAWEGIAKPVQVVRKAVTIPLQSHDWRGRSERAREEDFAAFMAEDRRAGFDFLKPPLMRLALLRIADDAWYFVNSHHHILLDGWSFALVLREALIAYHALVAKTPLDLPPARPYREYLGWVKARNEADAEAFWRSALAGFRTPTILPADALPGRALEDDAFPYAERELRFSSAQTEALVACARSHRITLNTLVQGAWSCLLHRHGGEPEVVFGSTVSGRPPDLAGSDAIVGLLINTLPTRISMADGELLGPWLQRLQDRNSELRQHEWTPLSQLQRWSEVPAGQSLFESIVVFDSYPEEDVAGMPLELRIRALPRPSRPAGDAILTAGRNNYPLSLIVEPTSELRLILCYERRRFTHEGAARLLAQCATLLEAMAARPQARLGELPLMNDRERQRILVDWNATEAPAPTTMCAHELFEAEARRRPDTLAVMCEDARLSYRELDARANQVAHRLRALDVGVEDRVALCVERSVEMIVGLLGVLKAGAAYVPLDPKFPSERRRDIALDSGARVVIARSGADFGQGLTVLNIGDASLASEPSSPLPIEHRPAQLAYLIYTSGSTGRPKGVAVEHRQLVNYVRGVLRRIPSGGDNASFAFVSTVAADLGHTTLFGALCSGCTLHVVPDERTFHPEGMAEYMDRHGVDVLKIVPSHLAALLEATRPARVLPRRCLVLGGEAATPELLDRVRALAPTCAIVNHYGPTETTVGALTWAVEGAVDRSPPIGRPLPNLQAYVLDRKMEPLPVGVIGELYIGGAGVTRGYHQQPALTAERFVPDPFGSHSGGRLYRTGDRARLREDGAIEFFGRTDHQVKIRGYRIELGEIEAHLRALPMVNEAVVVARDDGRGNKRLVGYVVLPAEATFDHGTQAAILAQLAQRLPEPMLPSAILALSSLLLTANGKVDRAALPVPEQTSRISGRVAPRNETEALLCEIWSEVLRRDDVGVEDDFFQLGGDSILSLQVIARARRKGLRILPKQLFAHRTIAALAATLTETPAAAPPRPAERVPFSLARLAPEPRSELQRRHGDALEDAYPASPVQKGMLFHALLSPETSPYFNQIVCRFARGLDVDALGQAWRLLSARHPILRTGFSLSGDGASESLDDAHQIVLRAAELPIEHIDARGVSIEEQSALLERYLERDRARGFDFAKPPLVRVAILRRDDDAHDVVWSVHHALLDGWCQGLVIREWLDLYATLREGRTPEPVRSPAPYRDYIAWLAQQSMTAAEAFFRAHLDGFTTPTRLPEVPRSSRSLSESEIAGVREHRVRLPAPISAAVTRFAREQGVTLNTLVQGAWALVLSRLSGEEDVLFGVTVAGRPADLPDAESIMGAFINSLPLRVQARPSAPLAHWLREIQSVNLELRQYEHAPLVEVQTWSDVPRGTPLFDTLLVFQNYPVDEALEEHGQALGIEVKAQEAWTNYPLTLYVVPGAELSFLFSYDTAKVDGAMVAQMGNAMGVLMEHMGEAPDAPLGTLGLIGRAEHERLVVAYNATSFEPASQACLPEMVAAQARRTPDAVAVTCGERHLTYRDLCAQANQLAHYLRRQGIGPESLVGVCVERSLEMVIGLLGVLMAGAAYVPLDPTYPPERLRAMVEDASLQWLLTGKQRLAESPGRTRAIALDGVEWPFATEPTSDPDVRVDGHAAAYVIYTSGSTGRPKGVMVRHEGVRNFLHSMIEHLQAGAELVLLGTTSISFDIAVLELFLPLVVGGRVVIARHDEVVNSERLAALLASVTAPHGALVLQATPTAWKMLFAHGQLELEGIRALSGGEAMTPDLANAFLKAGVTPINLYGPTETTVWSSLARITSAEGPIPLGRPLANTQIYLLDRHLQPVPSGFVGEIYIGGAGLARGYVGHPALTAERFVPDPFGERPGCRLYRTGDRARFHPDGTLEFLGRWDNQLKIRGFRIEAGEVETSLRAYPGVQDAVVVAREDSGTPRLVAYVVSSSSAAIDGDRVRAFLKTRLPDSMIPSDFVSLDRMPLTPNGKVNRKALPAPERAVRAPTARPRTPTEERLAEIWAEVLGVTLVGVDESFFELGGHSLLATRAVSRVRRALGIELPLRSLFDHPTVAELAREIDARRAVGFASPPPLVRVPREKPLPLSFAQQRLWFLSQLEPDSAEYNMTAAVRVTGELDLSLFERSLGALIARHEALRTSFGTKDGEPVQVIAQDAKVPFEAFDLSDASASDKETRVQRMAAEQASRPFDLGRAPLIRVAAAKLGAGEHVLVLVVHHIVADGWSMSVLVGELAELYDAERSGRPSTLRPLPIQYADFAVWQRDWMRGPVREAHLGYWRQRLQDPPPALDLRPDHVPVGAPSYRGGRFEMGIDPELAGTLRSLGQREGATLFMTLLTAFEVFLHQRTGQTDLMLGTDVAGRGGVETEGLIGFFVNLLVLRTDLGGAPTFRELLARVRETTLEAYAHQELPFEQVVDAVRAPRVPGRHPLVQTLFVMQNTPATDLELPGLRFRAMDLEWDAARFDLALFVEETSEGMIGVWKYRADLFEATTIETMATSLLTILRRIAAEPEVRITALATAEPKERAKRGRALPAGGLKSFKRAAASVASQVQAPTDAFITTRLVTPAEPMPLVIEPARRDVDLAAWAQAERTFIEEKLFQHGALLFRGFGLTSVEDFEDVARNVCGELFGEYGDLPREKAGKQVYGSTPYPADKAILFHNESSHLPRWPLKQWFFCTQASPEGGATPIVDCRRLYEALSPELRARFQRLGLLYVRNFTPGYDVSWQDFFHTNEPMVVEERCRVSGMRCDWMDGGRLRISQRGPAVLRHPKTGEWVFFNQIQLHHPGYLEAPVRESLLAMLGERWLPRNVTYGDGSPIDEETTRVLGELYERCAVRNPWRSGDLLLLDNMLVAHGRDPFKGPRKIVVAMGQMMSHAELEVTP
ncbi:amino acid adenylation domain-containing protein [Pendulispora brunnea]|uniref:Amino acid adenylation domain-containing protein n=1 Tax=Pendulispora brunnea TaxID=2905690 RepID=A0ABZ2JYW1_9BACT